MSLIDPYADAILISFVPIGVLSVYIVANHEIDKRGIAFFIFTISLTQFYIIAIDPSLAAALYTTKGNYWFPVTIAVLSGFLLVIAYHFGRKTVEGFG